MEFPLLQLRREINRHLGPTLKALGLQAQYHSNDRGGCDIEFKNEEGDFCPVTILAARDAIKFGSWDSSMLELGQYEKVDLGSTGWHGHWITRNPKRVELSGDVARVLKQVMREIEAAGVVRLRRPTHIPNYTFDECFMDAFLEAERVMPKGTKMACEFVNGEESFCFADRHGREWRVTFGTMLDLAKQRALVSVGGEHKKSFAATSYEALSRYLKRQSSMLPYEAAGPKI